MVQIKYFDRKCIALVKSNEYPLSSINRLTKKLTHSFSAVDVSICYHDCPRFLCMNMKQQIFNFQIITGKGPLEDCIHNDHITTRAQLFEIRFNYIDALNLSR